MELQIFVAFVIATSIMIALPGPSVILTVAHSISFGWRSALATVAGETAGIAVQLSIATIGLTSLLYLAAEVFEWIRWLGATYLIYLGVKQWNSADGKLKIDTSTVSKKNLFVQGLIITIPNPKSLVFIAAFLPQFIDQSRPLAMQFLIILPIFLVITFFVTSLWAILAGNVGVLIKSQKTFKSILKTAGGMMIAAGVSLLLARRANY